MFDIESPLTYAHILHNIGFCDVGTVGGLSIGWRALYGIIRSDLVIFEHSPTALVAARGLAFKKLILPYRLPFILFPISDFGSNLILAS